jgi:hypothetical protein
LTVTAGRPSAATSAASGAAALTVTAGVVGRIGTARSLRFVGRAAAGDNDVVTQKDLSILTAASVDVSQVQPLITTTLATYADETYIDTAAALLATSSYIDTADATRLAKSSLNTPGFPFTLDSSGKVPSSLAGSAQTSPRTAVASVGGIGTTTSETTIGNLIPIPDPGYNYRLMVTGTVHAQINRDTGEYPKVVVVRADNTVIGIGYGIAEGYQTPISDGQSSQIYLSTAATPDTNNTWTTLTTWTPLNTGLYATSLTGGGITVNQSMTGATIAASMAFTGAVAPAGGATASQIRIFCVTTQIVVATSAAVSSGTATVTATTNVVAGQVYVVQVLTNNTSPIYSPLLNAGTLPTWTAGTTNTLTITAPTAPGQTSADIPIIPQIATQSALPAGTSTTVSLRLQNPASGGTVSTVNYSPYLWVVPIPA